MMHYVRFRLFFREAKAPKDNEQITLTGFTEELDQYYRRMQGVTNRGEKPNVALGTLTQPVISLLQTRRPLEFDKPDQEGRLAKRNEHRQLLVRPGPYAFSTTANFESRQGLAIASSTQPAKAAPLVQGRLVEQCRKWNIDECVALPGGVPRWESDVHVVIASATDGVHEGVDAPPAPTRDSHLRRSKGNQGNQGATGRVRYHRHSRSSLKARIPSSRQNDEFEGIRAASAPAAKDRS